MASLGLILQTPSLPSLPCSGALETGFDGPSHPGPLILQFLMGLANAGRKRIRKSGRKGCLGIYFSISLSSRSQMAGIVSLYLYHTFCWAVPFGQTQLLPGPTLFLISGPRMVSASCFGPRPAAQSLVGPLHSAQTFSYIFLMCSLLPARTLDDISPLVELEASFRYFWTKYST